MSRLSLQFRVLGFCASYRRSFFVIPSATVAVDSPSEVAATGNSTALSTQNPIPPPLCTRRQNGRVAAQWRKTDPDRDSAILMRGSIRKRVRNWRNDSGHNYEAAEYTARFKTRRSTSRDRPMDNCLRGDKATFLQLGDMSLVLRDAHWQNSPQQPATSECGGENESDHRAALASK